jgi:hypothetical protein
MLHEAAGGGRPLKSHDPAGSSQQVAGPVRNDLGEQAGRYEPAKTALMLVKRDLGVDAAWVAAGRLLLHGSRIIASILSDPRTPTRGRKVRASAR